MIESKWSGMHYAQPREILGLLRTPSSLRRGESVYHHLLATSVGTMNSFPILVRLPTISRSNQDPCRNVRHLICAGKGRSLIVIPVAHLFTI